METEDPGYVPVDRELEVAVAVDMLNSDGYRVGLLLVGPTGAGKTLFVRELSFLMRRPYFRVVGSSELSTKDLIGGWELKGGESIWTDGLLTRALRLGGIFYFDELAEARPDVQSVIHSLADSGILHVPRTGEEVRPRKGFLLVASYNPVGRYYLQPRVRPSTLQRFVAIPFRPRYEMKIIKRRLKGGKSPELPRRRAEPGDPMSVVGPYLEVVRRIAGSKEFRKVLPEAPSPRTIETAARLFSALVSLGMDEEEARDLALLSSCIWPMSIEEETERAVRALLALIG